MTPWVIWENLFTNYPLKVIFLKLLCIKQCAKDHIDQSLTINALFVYFFLIVFTLQNICYGFLDSGSKF